MSHLKILIFSVYLMWGENVPRPLIKLIFSDWHLAWILNELNDVIIHFSHFTIPQFLPSVISPRRWPTLGSHKTQIPLNTRSKATRFKCRRKVIVIEIIRHKVSIKFYIYKHHFHRLGPHKATLGRDYEGARLIVKDILNHYELFWEKVSVIAMCDKH